MPRGKRKKPVVNAEPQAALEVQVGGTHYKHLPIQPVEYCHYNRLPYCESAVIKHVTRWRDKNGIEDLVKAKHYIDLLIQMETQGNLLIDGGQRVVDV